ncbi:hypothetical protein [Salinigranum marinum]|uniref:hypothetical protein n=1 Tax=Salinigranum marinum TaxID=1515595 RepID=UPI002989FC24|nr:hypothetical protein [Salinigranum marinum]
MPEQAPDLPSVFLTLLVVSIIVYTGMLLLNATAEASTISAPFHSAEIALSNSLGIALLLAIPSGIATVIGYLVWFSGR